MSIRLYISRNAKKADVYYFVLNHIVSSTNRRLKKVKHFFVRSRHASLWPQSPRRRLHRHRAVVAWPGQLVSALMTRYHYLRLTVSAQDPQILSPGPGPGNLKLELSGSVAGQ